MLILPRTSLHNFGIPISQSVNETAELRKLKAENKRLTQELAKKKEDVSSSSTKEKG